MKQDFRLVGILILLLLVAVAIRYTSGPLVLIASLATGAVGLLIRVAGVRRTRRFLSQLRWGLPFVVFYAIMSLLGIFTDREGSIRFYELAAQVIPVLLLAIALEGRLFVKSDIRDSFELLLAGLTFVGLALGEFEALRAVELARGTEQAFSVVVAALAAGLVAVATVGLLESEEEESN